MERSAELGDLDSVSSLLSRGTNANVRTKARSPSIFPLPQPRNQNPFSDPQQTMKWMGHLDQARPGSPTERPLARLVAQQADWTPLQSAALSGHANVVELLLERGAKPDLARLEDGATPLYLAAQDGRLEAAEVLLKYGAKPNLQRSKDGRSPLWTACFMGRDKLAVALLAAGADPNLRDDDMRTPMHAAAQKARRARPTSVWHLAHLSFHVHTGS